MSEPIRIDSKFRNVVDVPDETLREWEAGFEIDDDGEIDCSDDIRADILRVMTGDFSVRVAELLGVGESVLKEGGVELMWLDISDDEIESGELPLDDFHLEGYWDLDSDECLGENFDDHREQTFLLCSWTFGGGDMIMSTDVLVGEFSVSAVQKAGDNFTKSEFEVLGGEVRSAVQGQVLAVRGGQDIHRGGYPVSVGRRILVRVHF